MSKQSIPFTPELIDEKEEHCPIAERAESIVQRLVRARREMLSRGFGSPYLIFADGSIVSLGHGIAEALHDVEKLLGADSKPLGIITAPKEGARPFVQVWQQESAEALAELRSMAKSLYWRRFLTTEAQELILPKCSRSFWTGA